MLLALFPQGLRMGYRTQKEERHLRRYETIFVTHPDLTEEDHSALLEKFRSLSASRNGDILKIDDWGIKKLGYEIRKNSRGHYFLMDYLAAPDLVRELERNLRLNERVLKFLTVKVDDQVTPETAKALKEVRPVEKVIPPSEPSPAGDAPKKEEPKKVQAEGGEGR